MPVEVDAGDGAFAHADGGAAIPGHEATEKLKTIWIVADHQDAFAVCVLGEELLEVGVAGVEIEGGTDLNLGLVTHLGTHKLGGLQGALERAGDYNVDLHLEGVEHPRHQHALFFSLFDEAALAIEGRIAASKSSVGVAHEIEVHKDGCGVLKAGRATPKRFILTRL
jgi:hypothetical protein